MKIRFSIPRFLANKRGCVAVGARVHFPELIALEGYAFKSITVNMWFLLWEINMFIHYSRRSRSS